MIILQLVGSRSNEQRKSIAMVTEPPSIFSSNLVREWAFFRNRSV